MKYMKLGTKPDTFYTEQAVRSVASDIPADLIIHVNNTKYQLHKFPLLLKCGLLQRLCSDTDDGEPVPVALHDIPGGEEAFELCAKFCYGIAISISASNFVPAMLAARFLRMTEHVAKGNLVAKLETFFDSCVLQGWKDSITALQAAWRISGWSESRIVQPCIDSIVEKILLPTSKVSWSYTYTRPGYTKKPHQSVPKDWWTEDISELDIEVFRSVVSTVRAARMLPPPLIGEALHVYACKHLPDPLYCASAPGVNGQAQSSSMAADAEETIAKQRRVLETVVTMIPSDAGSVTGRFLLRLLRVANYVGASSSTRAQLIRQAGSQLDEAKAVDLLIPLPSDTQAYDVGAAEAVLEHFLAQFQRPAAADERRRMSVAMEKVVRIFDEYLQTIALDGEFPIGKFIDLAECLPDIARNDHDGLYHAIDTYLKEHPDLSKADKKRLCRLIDCRKLSPDVRAQAISNDRMPLRTIVQLLFVEQERTVGAGGSHAVAPPSRASVHAVSGLTAIDREDEPAPTDHKSDVHRPRRGAHAERAQGEAAAMTRSLSASTKTVARTERTAEERGSRLRNN
ncbi:BTB/POZ domain-containing protein At5g47800 isoform X2 [Lolium perenne]|uniref:BTB/POZ domain-containing protein At5g47800 isoform X2 n=1 Tax=Lolium perenne TaxID=4522 RepID=UPI0021F52709|nr:BTB/POZ domain-containing protein At5g47800 isoform X2 [Lolium perenne]XP_051186539.1 BTB/POZ domain-containing protein At5g47800 isoform X2 [Lolium perenne]XP_051186540.1 BTB/POZ domain-containing protein At5g47800 isoform X2 [Lolium perenne]XP_051186541.1 BTB/POZ domain-containing protein At5g47800 isoform X2 [Lolium perenne]